MIPGSGRSAGEGIGYPLQYSWASLVAQLVKNPPEMRETWVQSLGWEDPLEKWPREFHAFHGVAEESDTTKQLSLNHTFSKNFCVHSRHLSKSYSN